MMSELLTFLSKLNPLEAIRQYLNDRHERSKDHQYRNPVEARRLQLDNDAIALNHLEKRIEIIKSLGASDQDLAVLKKQVLLQSLEVLSSPNERSNLKQDDTNRVLPYQRNLGCLFPEECIGELAAYYKYISAKQQSQWLIKLKLSWWFFTLCWGVHVEARCDNFLLRHEKKRPTNF